MALVYFNAELLLSLTIDSLLTHVFAPVISFFKSLNQKLEKSSIKVPNISLAKHIPSLLISIIILLLIVPLLSSANPLFNSLIKSILDFDFLKKFFTEDLALNLTKLFVFVVLLYLLPRAYEVSKKKTNIPHNDIETSLYNLVYTLPKVVVITVLSVFFVTQFQLYFSNMETLQALGFTNSEYAREVFGQLSVVTLIVFLLLFFDRTKNKSSKVTTLILLVQMLFLSAMAWKSVHDYTSNWGYTSKRLYGYSVVYWLFALLLVFVWVYMRRKSYEVFLQHAVTITGIVLLLINVLNFDKLIYHKSQSVTHHGTDYLYLSNLSTDSESLMQQLTVLKEIKNDPKSSLYVNDMINSQEFKAAYLKDKYESTGWQAFNLSEYREYLSIKDYDNPHVINREKTSEKPESPSIPEGTVLVIIYGLPGSNYGSRYVIRSEKVDSFELVPDDLSGKLEGNTFFVTQEVGDYYLYLYSSAGTFTSTSKTAIEIPFVITASDLKSQSKTLTY